MENYRICKSCGKGFVYTDEEFNQNMKKTAMNLLSSLGATAGALSGNYTATIANQMNESEVRDFTKCPFCGSHDLEFVFQEEFQRRIKNTTGTPTTGAPTITINSNASIDSLIKRTKLLLEDREWEKAEAYCNQILDVDPENGEAYLLCALVESQAASLSELVEQRIALQNSKYYSKIIRFADGSLRKAIEDTNSRLEAKLLEDKKQEIEARQKADAENKRNIYNSAIRLYQTYGLEQLKKAIPMFQSVSNDFPDCKEYIQKCEQGINEIKQEQKKKDKKMYLLTVFIVVIAIIITILSLKYLK